MKREKAFISYSHKDKRQFGEFKTMLAPAIRNGVVEIWDDTKIAWCKMEGRHRSCSSTPIAILLVRNFRIGFIAKNELIRCSKQQDEGVTIFGFTSAPVSRTNGDRCLPGRPTLPGH